MNNDDNNNNNNKRINSNQNYQLHIIQKLENEDPNRMTFY